MQISRIRLSDKTSRLRPRHVEPKPAQAYEPEVPVEVREWIGPAPALPDLVLDAQRPEFAVGLRYVHSSDRVRSVGLLPERKRQFAEPLLCAIRLDVRKVLTVYPRCSLVGAALGIRMSQDVFTADLVVQRVEAIASFCLRFRV